MYVGQVGQQGMLPPVQRAVRLLDVEGEVLLSDIYAVPVNHVQAEMLGWHVTGCGDKLLFFLRHGSHFLGSCTSGSGPSPVRLIIRSYTGWLVAY